MGDGSAECSLLQKVLVMGQSAALPVLWNL